MTEERKPNLEEKQLNLTNLRDANLNVYLKYIYC